MDIGTAKPTARGAAPRPAPRCSTSCRPDEPFHAARWAALARAAIARASRARGRLPIVVGGTGPLLPRADGRPVRGPAARPGHPRAPPRGGDERAAYEPLHARLLQRRPARRPPAIAPRDLRAHQPRPGGLRADRRSPSRTLRRQAAPPARSAADDAGARPARCAELRAAHRGARRGDARRRIPRRGARAARRRLRRRR